MPHSDLSAFIRQVLEDPDDVAVRLVFADWLDEQDSLQEQLWAKYIRLHVEAREHDNELMREMLFEEATKIGQSLTMRLSLSANRAAKYFTKLMEFLPSPNWNLKLNGFVPSRSIATKITEAQALEWSCLPLAESRSRYLVGMKSSNDRRTLVRLERILGRVVPTNVSPDEIQEVVRQVFAVQRTICPMSEIDAAPSATDFENRLRDGTAEIYRQTIEELVLQARERGASEIEVMAYETHYLIRRTENGRTMRWHQVNHLIGEELVRASHALPVNRLDIQVRPRNSSFGPGVRITVFAGKSG